MDYEFDSSILNKSSLKGGFIALGCCIASAIAAILIAVFNYEMLFDSPKGIKNTDADIAQFFLSSFIWIAVICVIVAIILLKGGSNTRKYIKRTIDKYGEEEVLNQLNHAEFVYFSNKKKPVTIVTKNYIFEVGRKFIDIDSLDLVYGYSYKGNSSWIQALTLTGSTEKFATGINIDSKDKIDLLDTIKRINPNVMLGYTTENSQAHGEHVSVYKECVSSGRPYRLIKYSINLISAGNDEEKVARIISRYTNRRIPEAMELIKDTPYVVKVTVSKMETNNIVNSLKNAGAVVEVKEIDVG